MVYEIRQMKIYQIASNTGQGFAEIRTNPNQNIYDNEPIEAMWEDWNVRGNIVSDFVFSIGYLICKESVADEICDNFDFIDTYGLKMIKNPKELKAKNPNRLKWLPKIEYTLKIINTKIEIELHTDSSVDFEFRDGEKFISNIEGISMFRGSIIIPREEGKGFYFDKNLLEGIDVFRPKNSGFILCTEKFKEFCENKKYSNVFFLEAGETI